MTKVPSTAPISTGIEIGSEVVASIAETLVAAGLAPTSRYTESGPPRVANHSILLGSFRLHRQFRTHPERRR